MTAVVAGFAAGIYDMPENQYHADPVPGGSLSSSGARQLLPPSCPARFRYEQDHPVVKDVFDFGSAAHRWVLGCGPEVVAVGAEDWTTKAARELRDQARADGKIPLLCADAVRVQDMADALRAHPFAGALFDPARGGRPEQSLFWPDGLTGVWCRARLDWLPAPGSRGRLIVPDYKTCRSADPDSIARSVASYGYHQQAAFYIDGIRALGITDDPAFVFVMQEKDPPYLVTVAQLNPEAEQIGRDRNRQAIERFRDCTESGIWPGYSQDIEQISLPPWARSREDTWL